MPVINISVENKIAEADGTLYVCGNSDFVAKFAFDAEWEAYETKTARFGYNNSYVDVVFTGDKCPVPIISGTYFFNIGVYAGDLHTTTPARVPCKKSILCDTGFPADPPNDVYNQIMEKLNSLESADPEAIAKAVANYLAEHPVEETDPTVPEWAKAEITGAKVGQIAKITAVDASGVPTAWSPVDMPSGGGETWELIRDFTLAEDVVQVTINLDENGKPFRLKKAYVFITATAPTDESITYSATICCSPAKESPSVWGANTVCVGVSPAFGKPTRYAMSLWDTYGDIFVPVEIKSSFGDTVAGTLVTKTVYSDPGAIIVSGNGLGYLQSPCESFSFGSYRKTLFTGANIKIYGVRV